MVTLAPFRLESAALTHEGRVRARNEDGYCARPQDGLWAVADGMGGHEGGQWASACLVEALEALDLPASDEDAWPTVTGAVRAANGQVLAEARQRGRQMGTTVVAMLLRGSFYRLLWVGDSRAYRLRDGALTLLSRDHTQVQEMVDRGIMRAEEAVGHPMGHVLSRAIGVRDEVEIAEAAGEVLPGDVYLLCSDGLHGYVAEAEIARLAGRGAPERAVADLVERTLANGAPDNVTVIAIWASDPTLLSFGHAETQ